MTFDHERIFAPQYVDRSGPGSTLAFSAPYRRFIERFIIENRVKSIVDLGCGDAEVMGNVDLHGAVYVGVDVIEQRVALNRMKFPHLGFEHNDLRAAIVRADLLLCKDVIQHWSNDDIILWLIELQNKPFKFALVTNCNYESANPDIPLSNGRIETGGWRPVDLTKQPFSTYCDPKIVFSWGEPNKDVVLIKGKS